MQQWPSPSGSAPDSRAVYLRARARAYPTGERARALASGTCTAFANSLGAFDCATRATTTTTTFATTKTRTTHILLRQADSGSSQIAICGRLCGLRRRRRRRRRSSSETMNSAMNLSAVKFIGRTLARPKVIGGDYGGGGGCGAADSDIHRAKTDRRTRERVSGLVGSRVARAYLCEKTSWRSSHCLARGAQVCGFRPTRGRARSR